MQLESMKSRQINTHDENLVVRRLYETAFPREEQIPWDDLMRLVDEMPLCFTLYYDEVGDFVGFTIVLEREPLSWFWYFAVVADKRGKGVGGQILNALARKYEGKTYFLDMESPEQQNCPNPEQRHRRTAFYLRNGFHRTDIGWSYDGIDYTILIKGDAACTQQDVENLKSKLFAHWQPKE